MPIVSFSRKPIPQIPDYRPLYRISKVLLVLNYASRGGRSSLIRLHLFDWCLKKSERMLLVRDFVDKHDAAIGRWGLDPALNFALNFAAWEGLVALEKGHYELKKKGKDLAESAVRGELFPKEYEFICGVGKRLTEAKVAAATDRWVSDAAN